MADHYAEVAVNAPGLTGTFHYLIPESLAERLRPGHLAVVPFGPRRAQGIVLGLGVSAPVEKPRPLEGLVDAEPVLGSAQLALARWMSEIYLAPLIDCLTLMLPPGLSKRADNLFELAPGAEPDGLRLSTAQEDVLRLLRQRGPLRGRQLDRALPRSNWRSAVDSLFRRGLITRQSVLDSPSAHAKQVRTARLAATFEQVQAARSSLSRTPSKAARLQAVLDTLADELEPVDVNWLYAETGASLADLRDLAERGLVDLGQAEVWRDSLAGQADLFVPAEPPELMPDQRRVWDELEQIVAQAHSQQDRPPRPVLLHGVTGSGKTELYLRALRETLRRGRRGIVLVPEIALTPQTVRRFAARFPGRVAVWHSQLGEGERYDTWRRARAGLVDVIVGPRSALFAPLPNLGLIVLDEEHDEAYKQDPPFIVPYHAREAAAAYARLLGAVCLLGSATPDLVSYHRARRGEYRLLELPRRIMGHVRRLQEQAEHYHVTPRFHPAADGPASARMIDLPPVEVVDMRQELRAGNTSIFSRRLQAALGEVLERGEQAILFLNRRGAATFVFCRDCGAPLKCSRCEMPLTHHSAGQELVCHHCNFRRAPPERCPACGGARIRYFGAGTQKLEQAVQAQLPAARTLRWDHDVTRFKGAHDLILQQFATRQADILIGTQMIAKGLDLPLVTLVGVVAADVGLGLPDYRAAERTFQVLTQVAGRAGRSLLGGRVVLQTYQPEHYAIQAAAGHDYAAFFAREARYRKELGYPPYRRLLRLVYSHEDNRRAEAEAVRLAGLLSQRLSQRQVPASDLVGPAPCFFARLDGNYRWQIVARSPDDPAALVRGLPLKGWQVDVDPMTTL